jgi:hypothetical protein
MASQSNRVNVENASVTELLCASAVLERIFAIPHTREVSLIYLGTPYNSYGRAISPSKRPLPTQDNTTKQRKTRTKSMP